MEANYIDLPTILIYLFWFFFAGLLLYLHRENKREGYPLVSDRKGIRVEGFPGVPRPRAPRAKHPALVGASPVPAAPPSPPVGADTPEPPTAPVTPSEED